MKDQEKYTGQYAEICRKISLPNTSAPMENEQLLKAARETRSEFYTDIYSVLEKVPLNLKGD